MASLENEDNEQEYGNRRPPLLRPGNHLRDTGEGLVTEFPSQSPPLSPSEGKRSEEEQAGAFPPHTRPLHQPEDEDNKEEQVGKLPPPTRPLHLSEEDSRFQPHVRPWKGPEEDEEVHKLLQVTQPSPSTDDEEKKEEQDPPKNRDNKEENWIPARPQVNKRGDANGENQENSDSKFEWRERHSTEGWSKDSMFSNTSIQPRSFTKIDKRNKDTLGNSKEQPDRSLRRGLMQVFKDTKDFFTNEVFSKVFPPKLRRIVDETMNDFISSFKEDHLKQLLKKMLPRKFHSEGECVAL